MDNRKNSKRRKIMAGKKNNGVVAVISDLTNEQAAQLTKEIIKAKKKGCAERKINSIECIRRM